MAEFFYQDPYPIQRDKTEYRKISSDYVEVVKVGNREILNIDPKALEVLAQEAMSDVSFYLRKSHLQMLTNILQDPEATDNDRFVAYNLLQNAVVALDMFEEKNSGSNLPAQIDIYAKKGASYEFLFLAKGGGSANKTFLYQQTKSLLNDASLEKFIREKIKDLGTAACPPYHLALVIGGTSAEANLAAVKKASAKYYDHLPTEGNEAGQAFRDLECEAKVQKICQESAIGAQGGGRYL